MTVWASQWIVLTRPFRIASILAVGISLVASRADDLNAALTNCLFATAREAHARGQSPDRFRATLPSACPSEEAAMRTAAVSILVQRGARRAAAEQHINDVLRNGREAVIRAYSGSTGQ